jgi:hypothetical protein
MDIELITLAFLIVLFVTAEVYRSLKSSRGVIVSFEDSDLGFLVSPVLTARVRLEDGAIVQATANSCAVCMGKMAVGTQVRVYCSSTGYVLDSPWFRKKSSGSCVSF